MNRTREEIPHASFIEIEDLELRDRNGDPVPRPSMAEWHGNDDEKVTGFDDEEGYCPSLGDNDE